MRQGVDRWPCPLQNGLKDREHVGGSREHRGASSLPYSGLCWSQLAGWPTAETGGFSPLTSSAPPLPPLQECWTCEDYLGIFKLSNGTCLLLV